MASRSLVDALLNARLRQTDRGRHAFAVELQDARLPLEPIRRARRRSGVGRIIQQAMLIGAALDRVVTLARPAWLRDLDRDGAFLRVFRAGKKLIEVAGTFGQRHSRRLCAVCIFLQAGLARAIDTRFRVGALTAAAGRTRAAVGHRRQAHFVDAMKTERAFITRISIAGLVHGGALETFSASVVDGIARARRALLIELARGADRARSHAAAARERLDLGRIDRARCIREL